MNVISICLTQPLIHVSVTCFAIQNVSKGSQSSRSFKCRRVKLEQLDFYLKEQGFFTSTYPEFLFQRTDCCFMEQWNCWVTDLPLPSFTVLHWEANVMKPLSVFCVLPLLAAFWWDKGRKGLGQGKGNTSTFSTLMDFGLSIHNQ